MNRLNPLICTSPTVDPCRCRIRSFSTFRPRTNDAFLYRTVAAASNRSEKGAATQTVLMSVYRTLRLRGLHPTQTITEALRTYLTTAQLPTLPA